MATILALAMFFALSLVFGTLSWSRWLTWSRERRRLVRRVGRRPSKVSLFQAGLQEEEVALRGRLPWLQVRLTRAGSTSSISQILVFTLAFVGLGVFLASQLSPGPVALVGLAPGAIPWIRLRYQHQQRRGLVDRQLPKAVELMVSGLRAGQSLPDALRAAGLSTSAPLGPELARVAEESSYGVPLRNSLGELQERLPPTFELQMVVGAILLNQETGGNLIESLNHVVDSLRERRIFQEKLKATTAEARMSAMVLGGLPVLSSILLLLVAPGYLAPLWAPGILRTLVLACAAWAVLGMAVMVRMTSVEGRWQA
jgi:tight adherence protein B